MATTPTITGTIRPNAAAPPPAPPAGYPAGDPQPLTEPRRAQLDSIVQQMLANKEPDANIATVVADFKTKYAATPAAAAPGPPAPAIAAGTPAPQPTAGGVTMTLPAGGGAPLTPPHLAPPAAAAAPPPPASALEQTSQFATGFDKQTAANLNPITVFKSLIHPIDAYNADFEQRSKILGEAEQDFHNGKYGSAAIRTLDGMIPILGPIIHEAGAAAASNDRERQGRAVANIASLFAAPEAMRRAGGAFAKVAPKTAAAVSQVASDSAQFAADKLARAPEAIGAAVDAARDNRAESLRESAKTNIATALNPTTKVNKALVENKVAQGLIDRGVKAHSLKNLQKQAQAQIETLGPQIDAKFDEAADAGVTVSAKPIVDALEAEKQKYVVAGVNINDAYINRLTKLQAQIENVAKNSADGQVAVGDLRRIRQIHDDTVADSKGGFALAPDAASEVKALKTYTNTMRGVLADQIDGLAPLNKEFSFWHDVNDVTDATITRRVGQKRGLTTKLAAGLGAVVGGGLGHVLAGEPGAVMGTSAGAAAGLKLADLQNGALWNTTSAAVKTRLAELLDTGDQAGAAALAKQHGLVPAKAAAPAAGVAPSPGGTTNATTQTNGAGASQGAGIRGADAAAPQAAGAGNRTTVSVPGKPQARYGATYQLQELNDINASHSGHTFNANPEYKLTNDRNYSNRNNQAKIVQWSTPAEFDPSYHINGNNDATNGPVVTDSAGNVIGGNGRTMILQRVNQGNKRGAAAYRDLLKAKAAEFGIDPAQVDAMKQPILTRVIDDAHFEAAGAKQTAVTDFNKEGAAAYTPSERAIADSRQVSAATLADIGRRIEAKGDEATLSNTLDGSAGVEVLDQLIKDGTIAPQERAALANKNATLTKAGKDRISKLVVGRYFDNPEQIDAMTPSARQKIERLAAPLSSLEGAWDLTPDIRAAISLLEDMKTAGAANVDDFVKQSGLFGASALPAQAIPLAKALRNAKPLDVVAAARTYAQDAAYASKGDSLLGDTPTPESSFADSFGKLKSGAAVDAERRLEQAKKKVTTDNSRAPRLSENRDEAYPEKASDLEHAKLARLEPVQLDEADAPYAVAHIANRSAIEYLHRMGPHTPDDAGILGKHFSPDQLDGLISNIGIDIDEHGSAPALEALRDAAQEAMKSGKSLIFAKDHAALADVEREATLNEEINHAVQRQASGPLDKHLGASAKGFTRSEIGQWARQRLERHFQYDFRSPGEAAAEIGVRLMQPKGYQDLGLSIEQGRALASDYMQRLEKEYGHEAVAEIRRRILAAFRR